MRPATELSAQGLRVGGMRALVVAFLVLSFGSLAYEVIEWGIAVTMSPETAENYNGQQGDVWDAQKDMALAFVGSLLGGAWTARTGWRVPGRG
jgi:putative membrane protein